MMDYADYAQYLCGCFCRFCQGRCMFFTFNIQSFFFLKNDSVCVFFFLKVLLEVLDLVLALGEVDLKGQRQH
jgi:L-lysine 2,3-aminomutase